ncbi:titin-like [Leptopilina heterotoma]|uniref:titin-like n=1 Tax=Leptopilina heterotoma TaxID=63436 RepID=UPI001CA860DA|nr:titin-like [Leptopilina heterotoma]
MRSLIFFLVCINFYLFKTVVAKKISAGKIEGNNATFGGHINVYDVEDLKARLVIPVNKNEYIKTNYLVSFENKSTSEIKNIDDVFYMQALDSLVMFVSNLFPNTTYRFRVDDKSKGIFFTSPEVTTKKALGKPEKPDESMFYVTYVGDEFIFTMKDHLHWQISTPVYHVRMYKVDGNNERYFNRGNLNGIVNSIHFDYIHKNFTYRFKVETCNRYGCSDEMVTKDYIAGSFEQRIKVLNVSNTTCTIQWENLDKNSNNRDYVIHVIDKGDRNIKQRFLNASNFGIPFTIDGLHPGNIYAFSVSLGNSKDSPYEEIECHTSYFRKEPDNANITSFNISFDYGIAKVELNDNSLFENCAQYYSVSIYKKERYSWLNQVDRITCEHYAIGPYYFDPGNYYVSIRSCNEIGCSGEVWSTVYEIVKCKEPEPLSYEVLYSTDKSCIIQWIKQHPNISNIRNETITLSSDFPYDDYKINFIIIGSDDHVLNFHTAKDACITHHSKIVPAAPKEDDFDITINGRIATIKLHKSANKNCDIWYKFHLWVPVILFRLRVPDSLICTKEYVDYENLFIPGNYNFEIVACNKQGCSTAIRSKLYTTYKQSDQIIGPEGPLQVQNITDTTCRIHWTKPRSSAEYNKYYIKYHIDGDLNSEIFDRFVVSKTYMTIDNLQPSTKYNIILGVMDNDELSSKTINAEFYTEYSKEKNATQKGNINVYDIGESTVRLVIPLKKDEYIQTNLLLLVKEKNLSTFTSTDDVYYINLSDSLVAYVSGLKPSTTYRFRIVDKVMGVYFESNDVRTFDKPASLAGQIIVYQVQKEKVWLMVPAKDDEYVQTNFLVTVFDTNHFVFIYTNDVIYMQAENTLVMFVSGLSPNTTYIFRVTDKSKGAFYQSRKVTTEKAFIIPDQPKENLFYISFEKNEAILTMKEHYHWEELLPVYLTHIYTVNKETEELIETANLDSRIKSNHFTRLRSGSRYKFKIEAYDGWRYSEPLVTREYVAGNFERPIKVLNSTNTTCTIQWEKLTNTTKDTDYLIHVIDRGNRYIKTRFINASYSRAPFTIDGLHPGNQYAFSVSAENVKGSPYLETECDTSPLTVGPHNATIDSFNISFEDGVAQVVLTDNSVFENCALRYDVYISKKAKKDIRVVAGEITCKNYKVGPYYLEPGTYYVVIQACHTLTGCSQALGTKHYEIVKRKDPEPLFYKVLDTTDLSCTIQWTKQQPNMSNIRNETISISKYSLEEKYKINFIVIGTDKYPFNIHTAKDACDAYHTGVVPAEPKESDFDIIVHKRKLTSYKHQNIATIKLHNSTNNNCEVWYSIQMCIPESNCFGRNNLRCQDEYLNLTLLATPMLCYFEIWTCNKIGCSPSINTKLYINYIPSDYLIGPDGPIEILNVTDTTCTIQWGIPRSSSSFQDNGYNHKGTTHFILYYIHSYIEGVSSSEAFNTYHYIESSVKPIYKIHELYPKSNYIIEVGVFYNNDRALNTIRTVCHTL